MSFHLASFTWNLTKPIASYSTNGSKELKEISEAFSKIEMNTFSLIGDAGLGKSETARRYCEEYSSNYDTIIWIYGDNLKLIESSFFDLAQDLKVLPSHTLQSIHKIETIVPDVYKALSTKPTLFVFDNVERVDVLYNLLPSPSHQNINVLITSNEKVWPQKFHPYTVNAFTELRACNFVADNIGHDYFDKEEAKEFVRDIEKHPLVLQLALAYIRTTKKSIRQYASLLKEKLTEKSFETQSEKLVHAAVQLSLDELTKINSNMSEMKLLRTLTYLDQYKMERDILENFEMLKSEEEEEQKSTDSFTKDSEVQKWLQSLEDYAFIIPRSHVSKQIELSYSMHTSLRDMVQHNLAETDINECIRHASKMIKNFTKTSTTSKDGKRWTHHILPLFRKFSTNDTVMDILIDHKAALIQCLESSGQDRAAKEVFNLVFVYEIMRKYKHGQTLINDGKFEEALRVCEEVYEEKLEHFGESDINTLNVLYSIGVCLTELKDYPKSFSTFEDVLRMDKEHVGDIHVKTLDAIHEIGYCYMDKLDYENALDIFQRALELEKEHIGQSHVGTLNTMYNIGSCLMQLGNIESALEVFKALHEKEKEHFGDNHVNSLDTMHLIGHCYMKQVRYQNALEYFERVFSRRKEIYGADHIDTLTAMYNVGSCLMKQQNYEEAIILLEEVAEKRREKLGPTHVDTLISMFNVGYCLMQDCQYEEAIAEFEDVYEIRNDILGPTHVNTLNTRISIGECLMFLEEYDAAIQIFEDVLEKRKKVLGDEHISTLDTIHLIGHCLMKQAHYEKALNMLDHVLLMQKKHLGENHAHTLITMNTIGRCYMHQSDSDKALSSLLKVLEQQKRFLGEAHPNTLTTMKDIGRCYKEHSKLEEALQIYEEAFEIEKRELGESHVDTLNTMTEIGYCLMSQLEQAKCNRAIEIFEEIVEKLKEHMGDDHVNTLSAMQSFGLCFLQKSEFESALKIFEQLHEKQKQIYGENNAKTISTKERIRECKKVIGMM